MGDKYEFLDYLETIEYCGYEAEDELFYLDTRMELDDFRRKGGIWKCGFVKFKFPNINEKIKELK